MRDHNALHRGFLRLYGSHLRHAHVLRPLREIFCEASTVVSE